MRPFAWMAGAFLVTAAVALAELSGVFLPPLEHPAIEYPTRPVHDPVAILNRKIENGQVRLKFDGSYLRAVLQALNVPVESQMAVFSKTSFQAVRISPRNPRSLFFNDNVAVGWVHGGDIVEIASEDPEQGVIFYTLDEQASAKPQFERRDACLQCHESYATLGVPGMLVRSVIPEQDGMPIFQQGTVSDHRSPFDQRWGGWYVTGETGALKHMGNAVLKDRDKPESLLAGQPRNLASLAGKFDTGEYLSPYSDIVALLTFDHQMRMINLLTRVGWEIRYALYAERSAGQILEQPGVDRRQFTMERLRETTDAIVDYMLFVDEAPLAGGIRGSSGFAEKFAAQGPRDHLGRSLRQFDLNRRLFRYPLSYMIYSPAFDALPRESRDAIYQRLWQILSGEEKSARYARLTPADRRAIVEILRDTKPGLPEYFRTPAY